MTHNHPHNLAGPAPSLHPAPTPAQAWQPVPVRPVALPPEARLTVRASGDVTLSKPLVSAIASLRAGAPVDLVPPMRRGGTWHLDARPTAPRRLPAAPGAVARFRIAPLSREHLLAPAGARPGAFGTAGGTARVLEALSFALGPEVLETVCVEDGAGKRVCQERGTGYFELLPLR